MAHHALKTLLFHPNGELQPGDVIPESTSFAGRDRPTDFADLVARGFACDESCDECVCGGKPVEAPKTKPKTTTRKRSG